MSHLDGSFFISSQDLAPALPGCRRVRVGAFTLGAFSGAVLPPEGVHRLSISFETLAVAREAVRAQNTAVIERDTLTVRGSDMNTQAIYYIVTDAQHVVVFNDLFLARPLLEALGCEPRYDARAFSADLTFFEPVARLLAGEELTARVERRAAALRRRRIARVLSAGDGFYPDIDRSKAAMASCLESAVQRGVEGEPTVHMALSGGIDSGTIACLVRRCHRRLKAYTLGTDWGDEYAEAQETADFLGIDLTRIHLSKEEIRREIPAVIRFFHMIQPEGIEIALVAHCLYRKLFEQDPSPRLFLTGYGSDLLNAGGVAGAEPPEGLHAGIVRALERTQRSNEFSGLSALRCGVRAYHPFWQTDVISCALRIPAAHKVGEGHDKLYLREMMRGLLPDGTVRRRKLGAHRGTGLSAHLRDFFGGEAGYRDMILRVHEDIFFNGNATATPWEGTIHE